MRLLILISLLGILCCTGSPINSDEPYGYAPYAWITVSACNTQTGWCQGKSCSGFTLTVDNYDQASDKCTHYCPGMIHAFWRCSRDSAGNLTEHQTEGFILGAYVRKLDRSSCLVVP